MKYQGSKARISKEILPIILKGRKPNQLYVEPFVGGANLIDKVTGRRIGFDSNNHLIECLKMIRDNPLIFPSDNTKTSVDIYNHIKDNKMVIKDFLVGYYGFALSYGGKWFGGWCRDSAKKRDYIKEAYNNAIKQNLLIQDVDFICSSYKDIKLNEKCIIYCDPPYQGTTKYKDGFNHKKFWKWCRKMHKKGHTIFISEYNAPTDFKCIWEKEIVSSLDKNTGGKRATEKLFVYGG